MPGRKKSCGWGQVGPVGVKHRVNSIDVEG